MSRISAILILCLFLAARSFAQDYSRAKVLTGPGGLAQLTELGIATDHGTHKKNTFFISDFSNQEIQLMRDNGFEVEILIEDVQAFYVERSKAQTEPQRNTTCNLSTGTAEFVPAIPAHFHLGSMAGFFTYQEFLDELDSMAAAYPDLITVKAPIGSFQSIEGRPIYFVKISDNPNTDESEPEILYTSLHHAREPASLSDLIFYMWYLLENYSTNEEIQFLVDNDELFFVPMINPDGYIYNETTDPNGGGMHRKNRRNVGTYNKGVDLNRNYSYGWNTTGVSSNQNNDTYPGTGPFSEPETQAIQWFCENHEFQFAFNTHTYADDILFPIGTTVAEYAIDHNYMLTYTGEMVRYNGYTNMKSSGLYPASGDSDDYMYKVDLAVKPKIFAMTPEIGGDEDGFWPAQSNITGICQEMVYPNLILAHMPHKLMLVEESDATHITTPTGDFSHTALRVGLESGPVTVSIEPLLNIQTIGNGIVYNVDTMIVQNGTISYELNPAIQFGDEIRYVLNTEYGDWTHRDTITKIYGNLSLQYAEDASSTTNWTGNWSTTGATYVSPSNSFTDSPTGNYANNTNRTYEFDQDIDLTNATAAQVSFYAKWNVEANYDYVQFQVSTDGGNSWTGQCGYYTNAGTAANGSVQPEGEPVYDGVQNDWVLEEISLSDYLGEQLRVRFILESDGGVNEDGFYFDDFRVSYNVAGSTAGTGFADSYLKLFPNPASDQLIISSSQVLTDGRFTITDQSGKVVLAESAVFSNNQWTIDTSELPAGTYFVRVYSNEISILPKKLVIIR